MRKILIVNDPKSAVEEESILGNKNLMIFIATSSEEALTIHKREKVDLVITDLDMPGMSGDTLCSLIRKDEVLGKVPVLIVCGNKKSDLERCTKCGTNSHITKPLDPVQFLEKVSQLIDVPKRSGVRVFTNISVKGTFENEKFFCTSVDISTSGILIESDRAISKGDTITCSFFIPGSSNRVVVDCVVMRVMNIASNVYHYGAKFLNLDPGNKSAINEFVRKKTS
ncbi:MAG TPA: hypothetical protein DCP92_09300 [Nitrospiraceae bacterium]|jgi:CheY-like chemotaxis protein|nr:hypothetical protein [Nitrospiraceae bacterium]